MMDQLQLWIESSNIPIITAFLLGLLTAISPCPMATNITAIGYIGKDIENRHIIFRSGLLYTLGRIIAYTALGFIIIPLLKQGSSIYVVHKAMARFGEYAMAPAMILIGMFMLWGHKLKLKQWDFFQIDGARYKKKGSWGALLLGFLFALAFCPTSGVFYFGMLMPMSASQPEGYLLPIAFALATALPVIIVAWILAYSLSSIGRFYNHIQIIQKWMLRIVAIAFIAVGIYYAIIYYF